MTSCPLAVVIEPSPSLADTIQDCLGRRGFEVLIAATHLGAAQLVLERARVDFLVAAVPAPGEDLTGAYLADALSLNPGMGVIVMLSDPAETAAEAPPSAVHLIKPFSRDELDGAVDRAWMFAAHG